MKCAEQSVCLQCYAAEQPPLLQLLAKQMQGVCQGAGAPVLELILPKEEEQAAEHTTVRQVKQGARQHSSARLRIKEEEGVQASAQAQQHPSARLSVKEEEGMQASAQAFGQQRPPAGPWPVTMLDSRDWSRKVQTARKSVSLACLRLTSLSTG